MRGSVVAAALAIGVALSACGGSGGSADAGDTNAANADAPSDETSTGNDGSSESADREMSDDPFSPDAAYTDYPVSPLTEFLGYGDFDADQAEADYRQREQVAQEAIAVCMREQGFEYIPFVADMGLAFQSEEESLTKREYAERYGFGISTRLEENMMAPVPEDDPSAQDPNQPYIESLSESQREAYYRTLHGTGIESEAPVDESGEAAPMKLDPSTMTPEQMGCSGQAYMGGSLSAEDQAVVERVGNQLNELYQRSQADSRVVEANKAYASCMSGKGYPEISKKEDVYTKIDERMQPIYETMWGDSADGEGGMSVATVAVARGFTGDPGADTTTGGPSTPTPTYDEAALAAVQEYELAVAVADLECGEDLARVMFEVQSELEQAFIDANQADLEVYKETTAKGFG